jgi:hypothetical protein
MQVAVAEVIAEVIMELVALVVVVQQALLL